ncbi:FHA domain-containing protein [Rhodococcus sp. 5G237]
MGRDEAYPTSSVFARHTNVSRMHGILRFDGTAFFVTDSDSANGTFVGGIRIEPQREYEIRPGQELRLAADVVLELRNHQ